MLIDDDKTYGELMTFLLQKRRHHGTDERFKNFVEDSVKRFARDLRDFGLDVAVEKHQPRPAARHAEANSLTVGCE